MLHDNALIMLIILWCQKKCCCEKRQK